MDPTSTAYHMRHSRVLSSLSRLLGKFIFRFARIKKKALASAFSNSYLYLRNPQPTLSI